MKNNISIIKLCKKLSILSILLSIFFCSIISLLIFIQSHKKYSELEIQRLNEISPLILRPIEANYIIGDNRSTKALIDQLIEKYHLKKLIISTSSSVCKTLPSRHLFFLNNSICFVTPIPNVRPNQFIIIVSKLDKYDYKSLLNLLGLINVPLIFLGILISFILKNKLEFFIAKPIKILSCSPDILPPNTRAITEIFALHKKIMQFINEIKIQHNIIEKNKAKQSIIMLVTQVAHDIRSPLAAINAAVSNINEIPNAQHMVIKNAAKNINDIAQNLLIKYKDTHFINNEKDILQPELIFLIIKNLLVEKKYEHFYKNNININLNIKNDAYDCFANINSTSLKRLLSNLINNSIDSIKKYGNIDINLQCDDHIIKIMIQDNGCGIPFELLPKVTEQNFSYSKKLGTGFGLSYAKKKTEEYGGQLLIQSEVDIGTIITLTIPRCHPPTWFCNSFFVKDNSVIIILDNDFNFHDIWENFLFSRNINFIHLHNHNDLTFELIQNNNPHFIFLEYEYLNSIENGIDIIKKYHLNNAIIVTHAYEDQLLRENCQTIGVKIIPKPYITHMSITSLEPSSIVFIDDNESIRIAWELSALEAGLDITTYSSPQDFMKDKHLFKKNTIIYIDSDLNQNIAGEIYAKEIFHLGFSEIHLVTGHFPNKFERMPWIKTILGKEPPFFNKSQS